MLNWNSEGDAFDHSRWLGDEGKLRFLQLVRAHLRDQIEWRGDMGHAILKAVRGKQFQPPESVAEDVRSAAETYAEHVRMERIKARSFERFNNEPQPPRHTVAAQHSDRHRTQSHFLNVAASNPYYTSHQTHFFSGR